MQIGVDFGGTKIEAAAVPDCGDCLIRLRTATPPTYDEAIHAVHELVKRVERETCMVERIGVGMPGSISPRTGLVRNANTTYLNGRSFSRDLEQALGKRVCLSNDANCLAVSEARDGAGAGASMVFAVVLGTGCGGGLAFNGRVIDGANGIAGEWGHNPLPWQTTAEHPGPDCWCGKQGCLETWISGSGFCRDHKVETGRAQSGQEIIKRARAGEPAASFTFDRYLDRLSRALASIVNVIDPDVFVFGGGLSNVAEIYIRLPALVRRFVFSDSWDAPLRMARWGDSSGVRGAARLWGD